ncbi:unnamed protein product [Calicophoron daubneyi]|uniref:U2A'/phosphoprotein 32 family A C-terminal domain-containing protein n=1 Tax=Calicophoron daubneyi TaxID=300641 RepID=A0AAV2TK30_CALDB
MSVSAESLGGEQSVVRPTSALVQVTELSTDAVNPRPRRSGVSDDLIDEFLSEQRLKELSGCEDLSTVRCLELKLDVSKASCGNFGSLLPNLRQLRFSNSNIPALRDLGTSLNSLEVLWMPRCCLLCLDGLSSMTNILELYLAFNEIKDLSPCSMLEVLEILDLEGNIIKEKRNLSYLKICSRLTNLTLQGNPIVSELGGLKNYRQKVRKSLPQLRVLDDQAIDILAPTKDMEYDITKFDGEWEYINSILKEIGLVSEKRIPEKEEPFSVGNSIEPGLNEHVLEKVLKPGRSRYGLRSSSNQKNRPSTAGQKPEARASLSSAASHRSLASAASQNLDSDDQSDSDGTTSCLTTGTVVCGGISSALRSRKSTAKSGTRETPSLLDLSEITAKIHQTPRERPKISPKSIIRKIHGVKKRNGQSEGQTPNSRKAGDAAESQIQKDTKPVDALLQEEEALREECDCVLKELATWRKSFSQNQMFTTRNSGPQILKIQQPEEDNDAVLMSMDSDSTADDRNADLAEKEMRSSLEVGKRETNAKTLIDGSSNRRTKNTEDGDRRFKHPEEIIISTTSSRLSIDGDPLASSSRLSTASSGQSEALFNTRGGRENPTKRSGSFQVKNKVSAALHLPSGKSSLPNLNAPICKQSNRRSFPPIFSSSQNPLNPLIAPPSVKSNLSQHVGPAPPTDVHKPHAHVLSSIASSASVQFGEGDCKVGLKNYPTAASSEKPSTNAGSVRLDIATRLASRFSKKTPNPLPSKPNVRHGH